MAEGNSFRAGRQASGSSRKSARGEHPLDVPAEFHRLAPEQRELHARLAAVPFPKSNRHVRVDDARGAFECHGEADVREVEVGTDPIDKRRDFIRLHQAVGDVGIEAQDAKSDEQEDAQDHARDDSSDAVIALGAHPVNDVRTFAQAPKPEKVLRIALSVRVDLEDERDAARSRGAVPGEAGLTVAAVRVPENLETRPQLGSEAVEHGGGVIGGSIVQREEDEALRPVLDFFKKLDRDLPNAGLLVVDGQDDQQFRGGGFHARGALWITRETPCRQAPYAARSRIASNFQLATRQTGRSFSLFWRPDHESGVGSAEDIMSTFDLYFPPRRSFSFGRQAVGECGRRRRAGEENGNCNSRYSTTDRN